MKLPVNTRLLVPMLFASCALLAGAAQAPMAGVVKEFCADCHDSGSKKGGLDLETLSLEDVKKHPEVWEKVVRKMNARQMPPIGKSRPDEKTYNSAVSQLVVSLDKAAAERPNPGRTDTFRRLNRTEYQNAIRDLLALDIDAASMLPKDEASHGFDNVTVADLSPTLLERYITAAQRISRLAIGTPQLKQGGFTIRIPPEVTQDEHVEGLPLGTRGGALIKYAFPQDGEYDVQIRLTRDRNEEIEGLHENHEMEVLLDRAQVKSFTIAPPAGRKNWDVVDAHLKLRMTVKAGPHQLGVTFAKNPTSLQEIKRQPYDAHYNLHRSPRIGPAIYQVSINGPYSPQGAGDTPSRRQIFGLLAAKPADEEAAAKRILSTLAQRAYRHPVNAADLQKLMGFYRKARAADGFDAGIEAALSAILVNPQFLFRVEADPAGAGPGTVFNISDLELASRLSFFLWSSIPDDELLDTAIKGNLHKPSVLAAQATRMLADARSRTLVSNFADQWLYLRNLDSVSPDLRLFPDWDDNLRQSFRQETELFVGSIVTENRSVLDLLKANYTFLNERLAQHYGIPGIKGSRFRRVELDKDSVRGGLLRQGSILTVTSYADRTSPVIRGKWILDNLMGSPPPPPPDNVPALKESTLSATLSMRERLAGHRANPACAGCHNLMDPVGFSLENFDALGRWREMEDGRPIDNSGGLPDGAKFTGVAGLEQGLLKRPEIFVSTLTEKLVTYALGRGVEYYDEPTIRKIVSDSKASGYRFSSLVLGIVNSTPFKMRRTL